MPPEQPEHEPEAAVPRTEAPTTAGSEAAAVFPEPLVLDSAPSPRLAEPSVSAEITAPAKPPAEASVPAPPVQQPKRPNKALEALRAATERISGEHGKNARRAAIGAGAVEALERLGAFFEAEAAAETDPERGEYVLALADDARAAAGNLAPAVAPTRTDAHNEL